jgi:hypothetical protein
LRGSFFRDVFSVGIEHVPSPCSYAVYPPSTQAGQADILKLLEVLFFL